MNKPWARRLSSTKRPAEVENFTFPNLKFFIIHSFMDSTVGASHRYRLSLYQRVFSYFSVSLGKFG